MDILNQTSPLSSFKPQPAPGGLAKFAEGSAEGTTASSLSSDFETFLKMLTVQLQNQDPLNPVDSSDYAVQLATFSAVEQQVMTNDLLTDLVSKIGGNSMQELANWVGMEALVRAPAWFDGAPVTLRPEYEPGAQSAQLVIRDASGNAVQQLALPMGQEQVEWAGIADDGAFFAPGTYRFDVESYADDGALIGSRQALSYNLVSEARIDNGEIMLLVEGGTPVLADLVSGLRAPRT